MRALICLLVIIAMASCHKPPIGSSHYEKTDSSTAIGPGEIDVPEKTNSFSGYENELSEICEYYRDGLSKRQKRESEAHETAIERDTLKKTVQNSNGGSFTMVITPDGKATAICHEDAYKLIIDSLYKITRVNKTVSDSTVVPKCDSGWHRFTVSFFWAVAAAWVGGLIVLIIRRKYFNA
jgi:hypothetical protein